MAELQIDQVIAVVTDVLGEDLVGAYRYGSAVVGGLRPHSDLDLMVVTREPTTAAQKRSLIGGLLPIGREPRPVDLTVVVEREIRPWRFPPLMDFQYGEWWRSEFERGEVEPWGSPENADLAPLVRMVLLADAPLLGPPPTQVFETVERADLVKAALAGLDGLMADLEWDTTNVILTLARMWSSIATDEIRSKDEAAAWASERVGANLRAVLERAHGIYVGEVDEWGELGPEARSCADHLVTQVRGLAEDGG